jgi:hypothetical protein
LAVFHFHGFILQTAQPNDNFWKIAKAWTEADPDHRGVTSPSFWFASRGVSRLFFTSKSQKLIRFCEKRLKFTRDGERLEKPIPPQKLSASPWLSGN